MCSSISYPSILIDNNVPVPVVDLTAEGNQIDLLEYKLAENLSQLNEKDRTHKKIIEFIPEIDLTKDKPDTTVNIKDLTASNYNDQHQLITALQDRVIFLEAELYKLQHRVDTLYQDSRERHIDLDERVMILRSEIQKMQAKNVLDTKILDFNAPESSNAEITNKIKQVKALMKDGKYQQSKDILLEIEKKLPLTVETVKAHPEIFEVYYWRTEVDILLNDLKGALAISKQMVICFDNHERMPELLYKLGYLFEATGDGKESHRVLKSIITDYPHSSSASLAKKILRKERIHIK